MKSGSSFVAFTVCAGLAGVASAQDKKSFEITAKGMQCFSENVENYLKLKQAIVLFDMGKCPQVYRPQVVNSDEEVEEIVVVALNDRDLECARDKIEAELARLTDGKEPNGVFQISLDCEDA